MTSCFSFVKDNKRIHASNFDLVPRDALPGELYLENRMGCDSAIAYMDRVVIPGEISFSNYGINEVIAKPYVAQENPGYVVLSDETRQHFISYSRFYFAPDCFLNLDAQSVYDVFVQPKYHKSLKDFDQQTGAYSLSLGLFVFRISSGKVVEVQHKSLEIID